MPSQHISVLFLVFNRPDTTKQVFKAIRDAKPSQLFVAADGPRSGRIGENELCKEVREIATAVDWNCELKTLFRDENLGCGKAVSEAIAWFFDNVEEGIILEDDCLPDTSFFIFCSDLLNYYRNDKRIMHIGGSNFQFGNVHGDGDYYFSILSHVWGWATWRRAWIRYKFDLKEADDISSLQYNEIFHNNHLFIKYYKNIFSNMKEKLIDTWDFQWFYAIILNNGVCICPNVNLVKNIGFGSDGTHTLYEPKWNKLNTAKTIHLTNHPSAFVIHHAADAYTLKEVMGIKPKEKKSNTKRIMGWVIRALKQILILKGKSNI